MTQQKHKMTSAQMDTLAPVADDGQCQRAFAPDAEAATFWRTWERYHRSLLARRCLRWMEATQGGIGILIATV